MLKKYKIFKNKICQEWVSIDSYCKHRFFNLPFLMKDQNGVKLKSVPDCNTNNGLFNQIIIYKYRN